MQLFAGFSVQRLGFNPRVIHVESLMVKVALDHVFLQKIKISLANYHSINALYPFIITGWYIGPI
jgi:hypothetical protein